MSEIEVYFFGLKTVMETQVVFLAGTREMFWKIGAVTEQHLVRSESVIFIKFNLFVLW